MLSIRCRLFHCAFAAKTIDRGYLQRLSTETIYRGFGATTAELRQSLHSLVNAVGPQSVRLKWAEIIFIVFVSVKPRRCKSIFFKESRKIGWIAKTDFKGDGGHRRCGIDELSLGFEKEVAMDDFECRLLFGGVADTI